MPVLDDPLERARATGLVVRRVILRLTSTPTSMGWLRGQSTAPHTTSAAHSAGSFRPMECSIRTVDSTTLRDRNFCSMSRSLASSCPRDSKVIVEHGINAKCGRRNSMHFRRCAKRRASCASPQHRRRRTASQPAGTHQDPGLDATRIMAAGLVPGWVPITIHGLPIHRWETIAQCTIRSSIQIPRWDGGFAMHFRFAAEPPRIRRTASHLPNRRHIWQDDSSSVH